ncbi:MAG: succinylglutamate desuccinylase/aspartoacylase family protein [Candidatus Paceibacterota bacterium]
MQSHILTLTGSQPGPISMLMVGVHGDEPCGVHAMSALISELDVRNGTVHIAFGNPHAIEMGVRYVETNLNRLFHTGPVSPETAAAYEYQRSRTLLTFMDQSSALLDVHASTVAKSVPFAICEENSFDIAQYLPVGLAVSGFDAIEPGGSDGYMFRNNKIGICVECGSVSDPRGALRARASILTFLRAREHIVGDVLRYAPQRKARVDRLYHTVHSFSLAREFQDFEAIKAGETIGLDGNSEIRADYDGFVLFAQDCKLPDEEAFITGRYIP